MRTLTQILACSAALGIALSSPSLAQDEPEGRRLAQLAFKSVDAFDRGFIDHGQFSQFGGDVFTSMDTNENNKLTLDEFLSWGFGMEQVAEEAGRAEAYETALRVVYAFWDRNGDGSISITEHKHALLDDFRRADVDNDAFLSEEEFLLGFSINVAARSAINPAPVE